MFSEISLFQHEILAEERALLLTHTCNFSIRAVFENIWGIKSRFLGYIMSEHDAGM